MSTIIINIKTTGKKIAIGELGKDVVKYENNYYFDKECVNLDNLDTKPKRYTCPLKRATCDYYYLQNSSSTQEIGWCYESIANKNLLYLAGKIGFYGRGKDIEIIQE
jgi:uncharacterized protein (DUF427 family)